MTPEEILAVICPTMAATSGYEIYLSTAELMTSSGFFTDAYPLALALRAAHMFVINTQRQGRAGVETYLMEGRLAQSFGGVGVSKSNLQFTSYGWQLLDLIKQQGPFISITAENIYNSYTETV
jgi:hypothetical protein